MSKRKSKRVATGKGKSGCASVNGSAALGWSYSHYRASLYLDGERFAIVTPDGRNALSKRNAALLLEALNRKPQNAPHERPHD